MSATISTKYLNPTATRGAMVKAVTSNGANSVTVPYDYNDEKQGHINAAQKLKDKLGWTGRMIGGHTKDGYVFVFDDSPELRINPVPPLKSKNSTKYQVALETGGFLSNNTGRTQFTKATAEKYLKEFKSKFGINGVVVDEFTSWESVFNKPKGNAKVYDSKKRLIDVRRNPVKKSLVAKPKKSSYIKPAKETYFVEISDKAKTGFKTVGIFPNEKAARSFAADLDKEFKHTKYIRVRV